MTAGSAAEVVEAYYEALSERRWADAVALLHPDALTHHLHHRWHSMIWGPDASDLGLDLEVASEAEIAARFLEHTDLRRRHDLWVEATIERYPEYADRIIELRADRDAIAAAVEFHRFVGELVDGDTAYLVLPVWESPRGETSEYWKGLRIDPSPPIVLRRHEGQWKITNDLADYGFYVMFSPIEIEVDGTTLKLQPHEDEAS